MIKVNNYEKESLGQAYSYQGLSDKELDYCDFLSLLSDAELKGKYLEISRDKEIIRCRASDFHKKMNMDLRKFEDDFLRMPYINDEENIFNIIVKINGINERIEIEVI